MLKRFKAPAALVTLGLTSVAAQAHPESFSSRPVEERSVTVDPQIVLRTLVARSPAADSAVLFLHGFPENMHAWSEVIQRLPADIEAHAFDWPGFGYSSRPPVERFAYTPRDYARVLKGYIDAAGIDRSRLTIYATDIGALPALLLALEQPDIARAIIVGDFAPFDRPELMYESLRALKNPATAAATRSFFNANSEEILRNSFFRGLAQDQRFSLPPAMVEENKKTWSLGGVTTGDAFAHYYAGFTRDQRYFEENAGKLRTHVKVIWGADDIYIRPAMAIELSARLNVEHEILHGIGHYPHLQDSSTTAAEVLSVVRAGGQSGTMEVRASSNR